MIAEPAATSLALEVLRAERARRDAYLAPPEFKNVQQQTFFESEASEVLYSGAFRAGKSRIGCEKAFWLAKRYPGIPIGIFRKTASSLAASTERTLLHDVIPAGGIARSNRTERWYELANGSRIWLFGLDPDPITGLPSKVGSVELGWAFVDEAVELSEVDWGMVKGRLSWPGIPYRQLTGATNPASPKHWLKRRFTPSTEAREYLHASTFDNPALPSDYIADAAAMADDYFKARYILGEWVAAEGVIYTLPDEQIRSADRETKWSRVVAGIDWGYVHPFACEVIGQSGSGRRAVLEEIYGSGRLVEDLIPRLLDIQERHGIEAFYADPSEPEYIETCRRKGIRIEPAIHDVDPGIMAVKESIQAGMTVDPSCNGLLNEILEYHWEPDRASGGLKEKPVKLNDDALDALRYGCMALERGTRAATSYSTLPANRPPVVRRGDLTLVGKRYVDRA